jgi:hypothetical protein
MITKIKFNTAPATTSETVLETAANSPLVLDVASLRPGGVKTATTTRIRLGRGQQVFATLEFVSSSSKPPKLVSVEGNLPALLHGHEDRMIGSQDDLELALTRLRWLALPFVDPSEAYLILPGLHPENTGKIEKLGLALQLDDPKRSLFQASGFSTASGSRKMPLFDAGSVTRLPGIGADWIISELAANRGQGEILPSGYTCTRLEVSVLDPLSLSFFASVRYPFAYRVASLPFTRLFNTYQCAAMFTLRGALGSPDHTSDQLEPEVATFLRKYKHDPVAFHLALRTEQASWPQDRADKIRDKVFSAMNRSDRTCLLNIIGEEQPLHLMRDLRRTNVEADHAAAVQEFDFPTKPHIDISGIFSGVLELKRSDPTRRMFTTNPSCRVLSQK